MQTADIFFEKEYGYVCENMTYLSNLSLTLSINFISFINTIIANTVVTLDSDNDNTSPILIATTDTYQ